MSKKVTSRAVATHTPHDVLAQEASDWAARRQTPAGFEDATDAVPRARAATAIRLRMPAALLTILKRFAEREGIGYQVLIQRWLDDRVREERERLRRSRL